MNNSSKVIIIEGIIGAGKTTFSKLLAEELDGIWLREPDEKKGNPYLDKFYKDTSRWAFTMQLHLLNMRYRMHLNAQWTNMNMDKNVVIDRSFYGDTAFARLQLKNGSLSTDEFETYAMCYQNMTSNVLLPQICIYLDIKPEIAAERIRKRMEIETGRICENVIDIGYLKQLEVEELQVIETLERQGVYVIRIEWNNDREEHDIKNKIKDIVKDIKEYKIVDMFLNLHRRTL
jgi:deoxyadenosine/deoxycytidine kinase